MHDPLRDSLARLAGRAPTPSESGRTTFRLPTRAADALAWLTAQLRSTQKDVLAGLPDVVDDLKDTALWQNLGAVVGFAPQAPGSIPAPSLAAVRPRMAARLEPLSQASVMGPDVAAFSATPAAPPPTEPGERSTYVMPRDALDRLTAQAEALGLPRDDVVARALVALRAAVEVRQAGRPDVLRSIRRLSAGLEGAVGAAAEEAVALPPHDPIRVHLERAYQHLVDARKALDSEPDTSQ